MMRVHWSTLLFWFVAMLTAGYCAGRGWIFR